MRPILLVILLATTGYGQSLVENAAAAAGGSVGGVAGKKVGEGIANIFNKVDKTAAKASKTGAARPEADVPLMEVGPGVPKGAPSVPPPPPVHHKPAHRTARAAVPEPVPVPVPVVMAAPPPPAPPEVTEGDLKKVGHGMNRTQLLELGPPAVRITMTDDDGHLLEIYRYMAKDNTIGVVRLVDGEVSSVQVQ